MRTCVLDGRRLISKELLHQYLAEELKLPAWYGQNLDALYDCLTDQMEEIEFVFLEEDKAEKALGTYAKALKKVIQDAARENPRIKIKTLS